MKIRRVLKIVLSFILLLIILSLFTSGAFYLVQKYIFKTALIQQYSFWEFSLYILGYGASPNVDIGMQFLLGIVGIIMISLLSAFLTVNLFRRAKDVLVSENVVVWENSKGDYYASLLIGNKGKHICNVSVAAQLFDRMGETIDIHNNCHEKPIIIRKHIWRIDFEIKIGSFMHEYFLDRVRGDGELQLYMLVTFVDTDTGQESIICKEYKFDKIVAVNREKGFIYPDNRFDAKGNIELNNLKSRVWEQFKKVDVDPGAQEKFYRYICKKTVEIDIGKAASIVENGNPSAMSITQKPLQDNAAQEMAVEFDFDKQNENGLTASFIMALIQYSPYENWGSYYEKKYKLEFDLTSSSEVSFIQLEVKDMMKTKILDKKLNTSPNTLHYSFCLHDHGNKENWMTVHEICFTVFRHDSSHSKGSFTIADCKLVE